MTYNPFAQHKMIRDRTYFYGRREELQQVIEHIIGGQCCSIVGGPKIGKSSFLWFLKRIGFPKKSKGDKRKLITIYSDFQRDFEVTQSTFWQTILTQLIGNIQGAALKDKINDLCSQSDISFTAIYSLMRKITRCGYRLLFLFDEFDYVAQENSAFDTAFFSGLRSLANELDIVYVTASRQNLLDLFRMNRSLSSPFHNIFHEIRLGLLKENEAVDLIMQNKRPVRPDLSKELGFILSKAGGHPYVLQVVCYHLFYRKRVKGFLVENDLEEAKDRSYTQLLALFQDMWSRIQSPQKQALIAVAGAKRAIPTDHIALRDLKRHGYVVLKDGAMSPFGDLFKEFITMQKKKMSKSNTATTSETGPAETTSPVGTSWQEGNKTVILSDMYHRLRKVLINCGPFDSNEQLRSTFAHPSLRPWMNWIPEASNRSDRVDRTIAELYERRNRRGENALVLFLLVSSNKHDPGTECHHRLKEITERLQRSIESKPSNLESPTRDPIDEALVVEVEELVRKDELAKALERLADFRDYKRTATALASWLRRTHKRERQGILTHNEANADYMKIAQAILDLISN